ncbi:LysR family transcriptional regulator [Acidovorax sp. CCYZU-2555]|uniref:LysR family transcriptional regulator n=1 Tax=Acidovorax sp. CCYZU-2555 TaxID=2835042 RepID=UPI001BCFDD65|nr:LysR family transcriptional regulator [Acidovorax sp. CCYZU-2555]MBS7777281.1 LysR family transcriptional regulator [Acidovorax sp. CCYZU-2555]
MSTIFTPDSVTLPFRLKFRQMVLLDALADSQSLRKAALVANLTQPAATRAISELESAFGVQLFERSHRGMAPTVFGEALIRHARQLLFDVQRAHDEIQALRSGSHGFVRVGALLSSAFKLLPMAIGEVKRQYPRLRVSIDQLPQPPLVAKLREGSLDVILCRLVTDAGAAEHLVQTPLFDDDFVLVAARNHRLARAKSLTMADVIDSPWVLPHSSGVLYNHVQALFLTQIGRLPVDVVESTTSLATNLMLIEHYGYLNFMQRTVAQSYAERGALRILPMSLGSPLGPHVVAVRKDSSHPPATVALLNALQKIVQQQTMPGGIKE